MSTIQMESLWQFIQSLSLSQKNRRWLADRLVNCNASNAEMPNAKTLQAIKEAKEGKTTSYTSFEDFKQRMYDL